MPTKPRLITSRPSVKQMQILAIYCLTGCLGELHSKKTPKQVNQLNSTPRNISSTPCFLAPQEVVDGV
jgi:hypothetical protein